MKLKKIEKDMLYLLSANSSMNLASMSKRLKKSKQVICYNLNKMLREGIIKKFFPIVDYTMLNSTWLRVLIRFSNTSPQKESEIITFIKKRENVKRINKVDNYFDLILEVVESNMSSLYDLIISLEERYGRYILEDYFDIITQQESFAYRMFGAGKECRRISWKDSKENARFDKKDEKILKELEKNSRANFVSLSSRLRMNPKTIINRIKRLEKIKVIKGYRVMIDWKKLGKVHYKILVDPFVYNKQKFEDMKNYISDNSRVICISEIISRFMLEFDMVVDNYNEIIEFMHSLKEKFSGLIRGYDIVHIREEV